MDIIENNIIIFGNEVDLSYYFYKYRKRWRNNKFRMEKYSFSSPAEMRETRRRWLDEQKQRYLKKIETFEKEREFIKEHTIEDDTSERAFRSVLQSS